MKKSKRKLLSVIMLALLFVATVTFTSCDFDFDGGKVSVKCDDNCVIYEDDDWNTVKSYLHVTYTDSLGDVQEITDYVIDGQLKGGECELKVTYNGVTVDVTINVEQWDALEEATGLDYQLSEDATYYIVAGIGSETRTEFAVPAEYNGKPVKEIGDCAFASNENITKISFPNSVTVIGTDVFGDCYRLASVKIPNSVLEIGECAFAYTGLTSVKIPKSVTSISPYTFNACMDLADVSIPESITSIGDGAFSDCHGLTKFVIPDLVTTVGDEVFYNCMNLTSIVIPSGVATMGRRVFEDCSKLTVYCEAQSQPSEWHTSWNCSECHVVWGYVKEA